MINPGVVLATAAAVPLDAVSRLSPLYDVVSYDVAYTTVQTGTGMFESVTLGGILTDAESILTVVMPLISIAIAVWGGRKLFGFIRKFTG